AVHVSLVEERKRPPVLLSAQHEIDVRNLLLDRTIGDQPLIDWHGHRHETLQTRRINLRVYTELCDFHYTGMQPTVLYRPHAHPWPPRTTAQRRGSALVPARGEAERSD